MTPHRTRPAFPAMIIFDRTLIHLFIKISPPQEPKITEPTTATEHHAEASKGGLAGYLDKAKGAALDYLEKNPPAEEPASGLSGYLDKAKVAAKSYLESPKCVAEMGLGSRWEPAL